jgi:hypothetical protein
MVFENNPVLDVAQDFVSFLELENLPLEQKVEDFDRI